MTGRVDYLVVGAGVSGLSFANWIREEARARGRTPPGLLILEASDRPGGYCKTVRQDGFVWDYSGHFFHFRRPEIEAWLRARMPGATLRTLDRRAFIRFAGRDIPFPFQMNIHHLPQAEFVNCLVDLYFRDEGRGEPPARSFKEMLYARYGRSITELFLRPYNEKQYACDLETLDADAMGRFFPHAQLDEVIRHMRAPEERGYNRSFTYPLGGAVEYVAALQRDLPPGLLACDEPVVGIDLAARVARTPSREVRFGTLINTVPLPRLAGLCGLPWDPAAFSWSKVLVFNLGFDRKGLEGMHWLYFPDPAVSFYRVGWYDAIQGSDRMSLYVEVALRRDAEVDVPALRERVLEDLRREGIVSGQRLVSWHSVLLDPAYVHVTPGGVRERGRLLGELRARGVHSIGRYGAWTYCSIEDNLIQARELATELADAW